MAMDERLRAFSASFPAAWVDHPWGDHHVTKVGKKIFVFHGNDVLEVGVLKIGVKLTDDLEHVIANGIGTPTAYGLGRYGWVDCVFGPDKAPPPIDDLMSWIEESYRNIATKKLVKELDARTQ